MCVWGGSICEEGHDCVYVDERSEGLVVIKSGDPLFTCNLNSISCLFAVKVLQDLKFH